MSKEPLSTTDTFADYYARWKLYESLPHVKAERERDERDRRELAARRREDRWFAVTECLPPDSYYVLIFSVQCWELNQQAEMGYCKNGIWWYVLADVQATHTDHWRPLPLGPSHSEDEGMNCDDECER